MLFLMYLPRVVSINIFLVVMYFKKQTVKIGTTEISIETILKIEKWGFSIRCDMERMQIE